MGAWAWMAVAGLAVAVLWLWLRGQRARFVEELRQAGDPLAEPPYAKAFRQRFQAWLFGLGRAEAGPAPARSLLTFVMVLVILAGAAVSLWPAIFG